MADRNVHLIRTPKVKISTKCSLENQITASQNLIGSGSYRLCLQRWCLFPENVNSFICVKVVSKERNITKISFKASIQFQDYELIPSEGIQRRMSVNLKRMDKKLFFFFKKKPNKTHTAKTSLILWRQMQLQVRLVWDWRWILTWFRRHWS